MNITKKLMWLFTAVALFVIHLNGCSHSEVKKVDNEAIILKPEESIPPGTADIRAKVLNIEPASDEIICSLKVAEVFRYGAAMHPLPPGYEIEIRIPETVSSAEEIIEGEEIFLRVSYLLPAQSKNGYWNFIRINK